MEVKLFESFEEAKSVLSNLQPRLVKANGRNICVVRIDNNIKAFVNECPHQGASLHQGNLNYLHEIVCPLHSYRFDLRTGEAIAQSCKPLKFITVLTRGEQILLRL